MAVPNSTEALSAPEMELINTTRMAAGYNVGLESSGRELLVVVVKGTFVLPQSGEPVRLHAEQVPLVLADTYTGEPGYSAPREEIDFAPRKHACDVLLTGTAHAPPGQQVTRLRTGLRIGPIEKVVEVVGDRVWQAKLTSITASRPRPFTRMPISYDVAFGGFDRYSDDERAHDVYLPNPVGRGWHRHLRNAWVDGTPLPNTEEAGRPVDSPGDRCRPMAYGPLGRAWSPRVRYAGTYDQHWQDHVFPFLPADFDERYYQAAPLDQQMHFPNGPLKVVLSRLTPDGDRRFVLPHFEAPVQIFPHHAEPESRLGLLDTIVLEPDAERLTLTWRVTRPLRKSIFEIARVRVGSAGERPPKAHAGASQVSAA